MKLVLSALLLVPALSWAQTSAQPQAIDGAVVVRVDNRDKSMSMATVGQKLSSKEEAAAVAGQLKFAPVSQENQGSELDRENGASSWYCYYTPAYVNPYLYWYGNYYQPYYGYNYGYYSYYYYSSYSYGWRW